MKNAIKTVPPPSLLLQVCLNHSLQNCSSLARCWEEKYCLLAWLLCCEYKYVEHQYIMRGPPQIHHNISINHTNNSIHYATWGHGRIHLMIRRHWALSRTRNDFFQYFNVCNMQQQPCIIGTLCNLQQLPGAKLNHFFKFINTNLIFRIWLIIFVWQSVIQRGEGKLITF